MATRHRTKHRIATLVLLSAGCATQVAGMTREARPIPVLTDADGYPLVGNVMAKGSPRPRPRPPAPPPPHQAASDAERDAESA